MKRLIVVFSVLMRRETCFGNAEEAVGPKGWPGHTVSKAHTGISLSGAAPFRRVQILAT